MTHKHLVAFALLKEFKILIKSSRNSHVDYTTWLGYPERLWLPLRQGMASPRSLLYTDRGRTNEI